jgi:nicotinamidase/pyrazinamidase
MTTTNILFLIDIQNGFSNDTLTIARGGSLYVPGGEKVAQPAADLIRHLSHAIIILSQDFHPNGHISFASSHPGSAPFSDIDLKYGANGVYSVAATAEQGLLQQKLWPDHCVQGTYSALFAGEIMDELPDDLRYAVQTHLGGASYTDHDDRGNIFHVIRKGMRRDLDSYGIATENDTIALTAAPRIFEQIADKLQQDSVTKVVIDIGGLATNYCVEYSHSDIFKFLIPQLKARGIAYETHLLTDMSAGIPFSEPNGTWPDLAAAAARMAAFGTTTRTTDDVIRTSLSSRCPMPPKPAPSA